MNTTSKRKTGAGFAAASGSATPLLDTVHEIEMLHSDANTKQSRLLESLGWKHTSQTPGCRWMWEKTIDGRTLLLDSETALRHELETTSEEYEDLGG